MELTKVTGISPNTLSKLSKNQNVSLEVIAKICTSLEYSVGDILEVLPNKEIK